MEIKTIAHIYTDFLEKFGIPRQSGIANEAIGRIVFEGEYRCPEALRTIEGYSHLWLIWGFSESRRDGWSPTVRPPRLGGNKRVGVFATRSPFRPNSLGLSSVKLLRVEKTENEGTVLIVSGVDMLSGTPIYDIKPYLKYTDSHEDAIGGFADAALAHKLSVSISDELLSIVPEEKKQTLIKILEEDPRPAYKDDAEYEYGMKFSCLEVFFKVKDGALTVTRITK